MNISLQPDEAAQQLSELVEKTKTMDPEEEITIVLPNNKRIKSRAAALEQLDQSLTEKSD